MCHGVHREPRGERPFTAEHFEGLIKIAYDLGCQSINYDDLEGWFSGQSTLPERPLMIDFDHPVITMREEVFDILSRYGFRGNLFINTGMIDKPFNTPWPVQEHEVMTWDQVGELVEAGWHIGAHTVTHPNLSELSREDPSGAKIQAELVGCNQSIERHLGISPKDFAFTGTTWSSSAEREVAKLYRFGRLWIVSAEYNADGEVIRYAGLVGVPGEDEADGGPPRAARYITRNSHRYRLPSMELERLIYEPEAFREYLEGAYAA